MKFTFFGQTSECQLEMTGLTSVQRAHDELLAARPSDARHDDCPLCHSGAGDTEKAKGADVADEPKYTEAQHVAILTDAVARETASLSSVKEELDVRVETLSAEKATAEEALTGVQTQLDVLAAEKAAAEQRADEAEKALADFKAELEHAAAVEKAKAERVERIKAADSLLTEDYFTETRVQRWAEMSDEAFVAFEADIAEGAAKRSEKASDKASDKATDKVRETAAFTGGTAPTAETGSAVLGLFRATGKLPAASS